MAGAAQSDRQRLAVHSGELYVDLMNAADFSPRAVSPRAGRRRRRQGSPRGEQPTAGPSEDAVRMKQAIREAAFREQMEATAREQQRRAKDRQRRRDEEFMRRLDHVVREQETFVREVGDRLLHASERGERKKERLYSEWHDQVFSPIQKRIDAKIDSMPQKDVERRRREHFEAFLRESNRKGGIFRDIIIEADYDPLQCREENRLLVKAKVGAKDPTHLATNLLREKEALPSLASPRSDGSAAAGAASPSSAAPRSRETLDVRLWDKVESTPHGRYSNKPHSDKPRPVKPGQQPSVAFDHYTPPLDPATHRSLLTKESGSKGKAIPAPFVVPEHKRHAKW
eukprot:TRINITY_DN55041_c0_g1_i1.p2 TRINITY_DN55041_c0_g1~~TRINITY_DN55041_c0_g1_i1.p2  ORF type:complete len:368 (+),score=151.01 TRINITY_DN55041_c0_g1_i1:83-1105(+)